MGCDIHIYVEIKKDGKWNLGDLFKMNPDKTFQRLEIQGERNYTLFSVLANVRNYSDKNKPISEPKGVPEDASDYVKGEVEDWFGDGHSHSFLTLKELKDFQNTNPEFVYTGLLNAEQRRDLDNGIFPTSWCQGTSMPDFERREWTVKNEELIPLIDKMQLRVFELLQWSWQEYNSENDENIRIVFFFDN